MFINSKIDIKNVLYSYMELQIEIKMKKINMSIIFSERTQMQKYTYCVVFYLSEVQKQTKLTYNV